MTILIRVLQLVLSLSLLVVIHELGHFTFARIFGVRVNKFYMFFNPQFSIFRCKKIHGKWQFRFFAKNVVENAKVLLDADGNPVLYENDRDEKVRKRYEKQKPLSEEEWERIERDYNFGRPIARHQGHPKFTIIEEEDLHLLDDSDWRKYPETTEFGLGWVPLGGYCAIAGMVDETTTADQLGSKPKPWEYRALPTWKRLPIIIGGVLVNIIGAFIIYSAILCHWGESYLPIENAKYGLYYPETMLQEGFEQGDRIVQVGDRIPETTSDLVNWMVIEGEHEVRVLRGTDTVDIQLSENFDQNILAADGRFAEIRIPFVVNEVLPDGPADKAGMLPGDSVIGINGKMVSYYQDITAELQKHPCDSVTLIYERAGERGFARMFIGDEARIGVSVHTAPYYLEVKHIEYGFFESIPAGIRYGWKTLVNYAKQFRLIFTKEGAKSLGGFGAIGSLFPPLWDWHQFWMMTALLSIVLGFMNILPVPGLDGGHVLFLLWEMITGKKPSDKFLEIANNIGFYLLLALIIFANANDIIRFFVG